MAPVKHMTVEGWASLLAMLKNPTPDQLAELLLTQLHGYEHNPHHLPVDKQSVIHFSTALIRKITNDMAAQFAEHMQRSLLDDVDEKGTMQ